MAGLRRLILKIVFFFFNSIFNLSLTSQARGGKLSADYK